MGFDEAEAERVYSVVSEIGEKRNGKGKLACHRYRRIGGCRAPVCGRGVFRFANGGFLFHA